MTDTQTSKAQRIRKLLHLADLDIAQRVGCREEYVRTVRQRTDAFGNPIANPALENWKRANPDRIKLYNREANRRYRQRRAEARA